MAGKISQVSRKKMKSICVYCGSSDDVHPDYLAAAGRTGETLARRGLRLVYGGGRTGLMGALADGVLAAGGEVIGVIVETMNTPALAHGSLTRLEVTASIHQRKARMYELADGYLALPGGFGTFDELFETLTWGQIGEHQKPVGLLNVNAYFDPLIAMIEHAVREGFVFPEHRRSLACESEPAALLDALARYEHPAEAVRRWMRQG
jgi:uncharacterized protein (TIGR00730 family)